MKRPTKPRVSKPRLVWRWDRRKSVWAPYHRITWTQEGKQRERNVLLKWQGDLEKLDELYWACESGRHVRQQPKATKYTWRNLVTAWRTDPRVQKKLAASTRRSYNRTIDDFLVMNAEKDVRNTTRQGIRALHKHHSSTPRKADKFVQVLRLLWNYGRHNIDWPLGENPAGSIDLFGKNREYDPWPEWMITKLAEADPVVQAAAELILGTGQRPDAAINMRFDDFRGETMLVRDQKRGETYEIHCPTRLREFVSTMPKIGAYLLAKNLTEPLGYDAVEKRFRIWRKSLGPEAKAYVLHGLRKLSIIQLAESGATDSEIQAITNQSAEMVAYYRKLASRKRLSRNAFVRQEKNIP